MVNNRKSVATTAPTELVDFHDMAKIKKTYVVPTVFGKELCVQPLLLKERATCLYIPVTIQLEWNDQMLEAVSGCLTAPFKIADALAQDVRRFFHHIATANQGRTQQKRKAIRSNDDERNDDEVASGRSVKLPRLHAGPDLNLHQRTYHGQLQPYPAWPTFL
ncbi:hypothetical protein ACA910_018980 [Epithemia clementina (nom. ined.)]